MKVGQCEQRLCSVTWGHVGLIGLVVLERRFTWSFGTQV